MSRMHHTMLLSMLVAGLTVTPAKAITVDLTQDNCTGGCQPGAPGASMGTVTFVQNGINDVHFTVTLVSPLKFVNTGIQQTFDFNIIGEPTISVTNISPSSFSLTSTTPTDQHMDGFGFFDYALQLNTAQGGGGAVSGPLTFDVIAAGLTPSSFLTLGAGSGSASTVFFGADVINTVNGSTGPIGGSSAIPEPTSVLLFGTVLAGVGLWLRKRVGVSI